MTRTRLLVAGLRHYRRAYLAVAAGVAVATAVFTGALVVGDSVRGTLRDLTRQRLGKIELAVLARQPFRAELARELAAAGGYAERFGHADAALLLRGSASTGGVRDRRFAGGVQVIGISQDFARHEQTRYGGDAGDWVASIGPGDVALSRAVAAELGVDQGDEVVLRLPAINALPADSPLGEKADTTVGRRLTVCRVLAPRGIARFSLEPTQAPPRSAFIRLRTAQQAIERPGSANLILVDTATGGQRPAAAEPAAELARLLRPSAEDCGLSIDRLPGGVVQIESNQLVLGAPIFQAAERAFGRERLQPVATYLANTLRSGDASISYSTISGVESAPAVGPLLVDGRPLTLADDGVALNDHAARRLGVGVGDAVSLRYYEPESTYGRLVEAPPVPLTVRAVVPLAGPDGKATAAADPLLTPTLEGVTDAASIDDWDLPFELTEPITDADEDYWDAHRATPKAFLSLRRARELFATRWGAISLLRLPDWVGTPDQAAEALLAELDPADAGIRVLPVRREGLDAAAGSTSFDVLFFGFSLFLIAASVMLIALLVALGVDARSQEVGLLAAIGWGRSRIRGQLLRELLLVAAAGAAVGVPAGVAYAGAMIWGLTTIWLAAVTTPLLKLTPSAGSLAVGGVAGVAIAAAVCWLVVRRLLTAPVRALMAGRTTGTTPRGDRAQKRRPWCNRAELLLAAATLPLAAAWGVEDAQIQAFYFFAGGAALLAWSSWSVYRWLGRRRWLLKPGPKLTLATLAARNTARNRGRSVLTIGSIAASSFLILAISAFRLAPSDAAAGGFSLVATTAQPIHYDLNTPQGRLELGFREAEEQLLDRFTVYALRVRDGQDASCLNLFQTRQPRVLGVPATLITRGGFAFAAAANRRAPWRALSGEDAAADSPRGQADPVPVILDIATARYGLKRGGRVGARFSILDAAEQQVEVATVGLLSNSMLQGDLLMSERNFLRLYPDVAGSRMLFFEPKDPAAAAESDRLAGLLESRLADYGLDAERADRRVARFLAVQNTYLATFQTLGGLGLLLGVVGVAVVQVRNVNDRRAELALLRATGFGAGRLRQLVATENLLLLGGGLLIGAGAAAATLVPQTLAANAASARPPWLASLALVAAVLIVGLVVGGMATRSAARSAVLPALRGE